MNIFITGGSGLLGSALLRLLQGPHNCYAPPRRKFDLETGVYDDFGNELAFLCAGTKGSEACEGNRAAFRADVDGNLRLARTLLKQNVFVVFVSSDAVEWANSAYASNRRMVELALGGLPNVAIFRPGRFDSSNVGACAALCAKVGLQRIEGLTRWP